MSQLVFNLLKKNDLSFFISQFVLQIPTNNMVQFVVWRICSWLCKGTVANNDLVLSKARCLNSDNVARLERSSDIYICFVPKATSQFSSP